MPVAPMRARIAPPRTNGVQYPHQRVTTPSLGKAATSAAGCGFAEKRPTIRDADANALTGKRQVKDRKYSIISAVCTKSLSGCGAVYPLRPAHRSRK